MVDDLPLMPWLHDWTRGDQNFPAYVFANDTSQGTYFAAVDLLADPTTPVENSNGPGLISEQSGLLKWFPEYSELTWRDSDAVRRVPPMQVVALGGNLTWPVSEFSEVEFQQGEVGHWNVEMPFALFGRFPKERLDLPPTLKPIRVALTWRILFSVMMLCTVGYCVCFLYANTVTHTVFATFEPSGRWRFWLFKVAIPAALFGGAFRLLSWTNEMPGYVSQSVLDWGMAAETMSTVLAPLAIAISAAGKMIAGPPPRWNVWMLLSFPPVIFSSCYWHSSRSPATRAHHPSTTQISMSDQS